jgi:integrase
MKLEQYPGLYTRPDGKAIWCCYSLRGKQFRQSTGETEPKKAFKFLQNKLREIAADQIGARTFVTPKAEKITVGALLDALTADYELRGKASAQFASHLKPVRKYFADWRAMDISAESVDVFISDLLEQGKAVATINRSTQLLGQAFVLAIRRKHLTSAPYIRHLDESGNVRQGFFEQWEFRRVVDNLPDYLKDFARFGYHTGWRRSEILSLRWEDVDGEMIRLRGVNSKNGEPRSTAARGELAEVIQRRKAARKIETESGFRLAELIFHNDGNPIVDFRKAWATACKLAGCEGRLFHDLRRTYSRNSTRAGNPQHVTMKQTGHKTDSMFRRYNVVIERDMVDAMERTQAYLSATAAEDAKRQPAEMPRRVM